MDNNNNNNDDNFMMRSGCPPKSTWADVGSESDEEDDEDDDDSGPAAKRSRRTLGLEQKVDDSLLTHMTNAVVPRETDQRAEMFQACMSYPPIWSGAAAPPPVTHGIANSYLSSQGSDQQLLFDEYRAGFMSNLRLQCLSHHEATVRERNLSFIPRHFLDYSAQGFSGMMGVNTAAATQQAAAFWNGNSFLNAYPPQMSSLSSSVLPSVQSSAVVPHHHDVSQQISWMQAALLQQQQQQQQQQATFHHHQLQLPSTFTDPSTEARRFDEESSAAIDDCLTSDGKEYLPGQLPAILALPEDRHKLSVHQVFLRHQIEAFEASKEDVSTHTRGRNKRIKLGQVGIRCRHCAHLSVAAKQKGSVYFPATLLGLYQAAQNMSATHLQCGLCSEAPLTIKRQFVTLMSTRAFGSGAGRPYWAQAAKKLGLVDTDEGIIRFVKDVVVVNPDLTDSEGEGLKTAIP